MTLFDSIQNFQIEMEIADYLHNGNCNKKQKSCFISEFEKEEIFSNPFESTLDAMNKFDTLSSEKSFDNEPMHTQLLNTITINNDDSSNSAIPYYPVPLFSNESNDKPNVNTFNVNKNAKKKKEGEKEKEEEKEKENCKEEEEEEEDGDMEYCEKDEEDEKDDKDKEYKEKYYKRKYGKKLEKLKELKEPEIEKGKIAVKDSFKKKRKYTLIIPLLDEKKKDEKKGRKGRKGFIYTKDHDYDKQDEREKNFLLNNLVELNNQSNWIDLKDSVFDKSKFNTIELDSEKKFCLFSQVNLFQRKSYVNCYRRFSPIPIIGTKELKENGKSNSNIEIKGCLVDLINLNTMKIVSTKEFESNVKFHKKHQMCHFILSVKAAYPKKWFCLQFTIYYNLNSSVVTQCKEIIYSDQIKIVSNTREKSNWKEENDKQISLMPNDIKEKLINLRLLNKIFT